jgi:hypothetical protein
MFYNNKNCEQGMYRDLPNATRNVRKPAGIVFGKLKGYRDANCIIINLTVITGLFCYCLFSLFSVICLEIGQNNPLMNIIHSNTDAL